MGVIEIFKILLQVCVTIWGPNFISLGYVGTILVFKIFMQVYISI
jgi:hypothetical protein